MEHTDDQGEYTIMSDGKETYIVDAVNGGTIHSLAPLGSSSWTQLWPLTDMPIGAVEAATSSAEVGQGTLGSYTRKNGTSSAHETKLEQAQLLEQVASSAHLWTSVRHEKPY